jgi:hypothetical protein
MFKPTGFFKSTRIREYDAYCQGVEDAMEVATEARELEKEELFRDKFLNLVVEAADDFTN